MSKYNITVNGELLDGQELEQVKQRITELLNLDSESDKLEKIFSGKVITVKKGLSKEQADKYSQTIRKTGLACKLRIDETAQPLKETTQAVGDPSEEKEVDGFNLFNPKKLPASAGWGWIKEGFKYFKMSPGLWIGTVFLYGVTFIVLSLIPVVSIIAGVTTAVFTGSFMLICHKQYQGEKFSIGDLFSGFKKHLGRLMAVGALYFLGSLMILALMVGGMFVIPGGMMEVMASMEAGVPWMLIIIILIGFLLFFPLIMAYWFAPALIVLHDIPAIQAMKLSFKGCLRNIWPFTLYGLITIALAFLAVLPLMLGLLVLMPVIFAAMFSSYRQIYTISEQK